MLPRPCCRIGDGARGGYLGSTYHFSPMRTLLIVSPHFSPINAPDMQRVRMSLSYFREFGWHPLVLAVDPKYVDGVSDPVLLECLPSDVEIRRVPALRVEWTRRLGFSSLALRALPFLYRAGAELITRHRVDVIYFSTTQFWTMTLGRLWKRRFGVPFVLDLQDPWVSDYYEQRNPSERPPKYRLARALHRVLEPWTMQVVDGIVAVSEDYHRDLRRRYPWISPELCRTIPFGGEPGDFKVAARFKKENEYFQPGDGLIHGVYVGVLGRVMRHTCVAICAALREGLERSPELFSRVRLHFVGTDYAAPPRRRATIQPIALEMGLGEQVREDPRRIPYFEALNVLRDADFLLLVGSDNPQYTPSKVFPYILARKPLLAILHERSAAVDMLRRAGEVVSFSSDTDLPRLVASLRSRWTELLQRLPYEPATHWEAFEAHTALETTRRQCALFDRVVHTRTAPRSAATFGKCR